MGHPGANRSSGQLRSGDRAMADRFKMVGNYHAPTQSREFKHFIYAHDDLVADVETCAPCGNDADLRLMPQDELPNGRSEKGVASQIQAGLAGHLDQIANAVLHQLPDQPLAMRAPDRADKPTQEPAWLLMMVRKRLDVQPSFREMRRIMRGADDWGLPLSKPVLGCPIEVVEVAFLAVRDQAVRYPFERILR